jgi:hypothetical protein
MGTDDEEYYKEMADNYETVMRYNVRRMWIGASKLYLVEAMMAYLEWKQESE